MASQYWASVSAGALLLAAWQLGWFCLLLVALVAGLLAWTSKPPPEPKATAGAQLGDLKQQPEQLDDGDENPVRWCFVPSSGILHANGDAPVQIQNDFAKVAAFAMHRPTHDAARDASGDYPYADYFAGKKRLWEVRIQLSFKAPPQTQLYFGIEMGYPSGSSGMASAALRQLLLTALRASIGNEFYFSKGEDPNTMAGEAEPTSFALPLWAADQFHVCSNGDQPPDVTKDMSDVGVRRTSGIRKYCEAMKDLSNSWSCDDTYTFCFWGVSQILDIACQQVRIKGYNMPFDTLLGAGQPVYVVFYELMPGQNPADTRHLISRKKYVFKVALWSMLKPPNQAFLDKAQVSTGVAARLKSGSFSSISGLSGAASKKDEITKASILQQAPCGCMPLTGIRKLVKGH